MDSVILTALSEVIMKFLLILILWLVWSLSAMASSFSTTYQATVTATTTSTKILDAKTDRAYLLILNNGDGDVYLKTVSAHSATEGIVIFAGGAWEPNAIPRDAIYIKAASGTEDLYVIEGSL